MINGGRPRLLPACCPPWPARSRSTVRVPERLRLRPSSCPLTWSFPLICTIWSALTQRPVGPRSP